MWGTRALDLNNVWHGRFLCLVSRQLVSTRAWQAAWLTTGRTSRIRTYSTPTDAHWTPRSCPTCWNVSVHSRPASNSSLPTSTPSSSPIATTCISGALSSSARAAALWWVSPPLDREKNLDGSCSDSLSFIWFGKSLGSCAEVKIPFKK